MRRPEQDPPAPEVRAPGGLADGIGMRLEPVPHQRFGDRRRLRARGDGRQVAQPGKAVEPVAERAREIGLGEMEVADLAGFAAKAEGAVEQRLAAARIAEQTDRRARRSA